MRTAPRGFLLGVVTLAGLVLLFAIAADDGGRDLGFAAAVLLGLVEGLTEWLPISSTGHLAVTQELLGIDGDAADSYAIAIQAGAILAVAVLYRHRFAAMLRGARGADPAGRQVLVAIIVACLPAVVVGLALEDVIKENLFGLWPIVAAWLVGGVAILALARTGQLLPGHGASLTALRWRAALVVGMPQTLALWPGVSRSLVTILAALMDSPSPPLSSSASCSVSSCSAERRSTRRRRRGARWSPPTAWPHRCWASPWRFSPPWARCTGWSAT